MIFNEVVIVAEMNDLRSHIMKADLSRKVIIIIYMTIFITMNKYFFPTRYNITS
jgi:hypothetical protein